MVYENNCHSTLLGPPAYEFVRVTRPYIHYIIILQRMYTYVSTINILCIETFFNGVRVAVDAYSVTIGDYETPGMELAPGFWVKNDDDNNNYDTRRIWAIIIY